MNTDRLELAAAVSVVVVSADLQAAVAVVDLVDLAQKVVDLGLVVPVVKAVDRVVPAVKVADPVAKVADLGAKVVDLGEKAVAELAAAVRD